MSLMPAAAASDDREHFAPRHRFEQRKIVDRLETCEAHVLPDDVAVEISHAGTFSSFVQARTIGGRDEAGIRGRL